nr:CDP-glycerol glycerophosphotransferase family protein [uncultured Sellimonas sp.]
MKYLKLMMIYACRLGLRIVYLVPVKKNRIYLSADRGSGIRCNPLYIYRYLKKNYPGKYEYIWQYNGTGSEKDTTYVKPGSLKDLYYMLTSKILISNDGFGSFIPKRKSQTFINTWHGGGAYKKSGVDFITDQHPVDLKINRICGKQTDIFLSSSRKFSEVMSKAKMVPPKRFLECGMPRNDFLVTGTKEDIGDKVKKYFGIDKEKKIVLFAPTYRGEEQTAKFHSELETKGCLDALKERFGGEWVFLMRKHHFVKSTTFDGCINASDYPDMQELLYAADVFITDYSSTIWDYSLMFKPGFLFVPDLAQYSKERSFYTDPETWAFPLAKTNGELQELIRRYDEEKSAEKIKEHHRLLGYKESGHAAKKVAEKIIERIG